MDFDPRGQYSPIWSVFDADGRHLGDVGLPAGFQLLRIVGDRVYGIAREELDVQSVMVLRIVME